MTGFPSSARWEPARPGGWPPNARCRLESGPHGPRDRRNLKQAGDLLDLDDRRHGAKAGGTVQTSIPNVYLESNAIATIVETDLRLALGEALDKLILDAIAGSGVQVPGTDALLVSIRKAVTQIQANGYSPDLLLLTPAADEISTCS